MGEKVSLITNLAEWARWKDIWDDLLANSTAFEARIFLSHEWLTTWWQYFGRGRLTVVVVSDGQRLICAAPLFIAPSALMPFTRLVRFVGNGNSDYADFLVRNGCEEAAQQIWRWLFSNSSLWDAIALHELPQNSEAIRALQSVKLPTGFQVTILPGEVCHRVPLNRTDGSWRESSSKSLREQLKRRERQIAKNFRTEFKVAENADEVATLMAQLFALHRLRWGQLGQTGVFIFPKVRKFHTDFAKQALQQGWLRLCWLSLDNCIAAAYYAFKCDDYAGFYSCGFNPAFARYSVGKVLLAKLIDEAEREGARVFDFMRGDETYKAEFGTTVQRNLHLFVWQLDKAISRAAAVAHKFTTWLALKVKEAAQR